MKKKLFKLAYYLHLYKIAKAISPSMYFFEEVRKFAKAVEEALKEGAK